MAYLVEEIRKQTKLPLGVNVLWNDYQVAFSLAKAFNLNFIRVPVFVDDVKPYCGLIRGNPRKVLSIRRQLGAGKVAILADVHVKHAKLISKKNLVTSAKKAIKEGADGLIITGDWTGISPDMRDLRKVRKAVFDFPIFVGSGANERNVQNLCSIANGVIVSTSLKEGGRKKGERNVKSYSQRIDRKKVRTLVKRLAVK
jgi:membrane complex biogenesis BtpA family protein